MTKTNYIYKILSWAAVILWMALIFRLSSHAGNQSEQLSVGIVEIIIRTIKKVIPNISFDIMSLNYIIRKNAHFIAYFVLGILVLNALRSSRVHGFKSVAITILICIIYAITDEIHQLFVPDRAGQIRDVLIDSAGASIGALIYLPIASKIRGNVVK